MDDLLDYPFRQYLPFLEWNEAAKGGRFAVWVFALDRVFSQMIRCNPRGNSGFFYSMNVERIIHKVQGCSVGAVKDRENGGYYIGCSQCEQPVKIKSDVTIFNRVIFRRIGPRIGKKGTPNS